MEVVFQSDIPLYEQIAHQVLAQIDKGKLKPGDQLPTTRELADKLGVNFNTVARAYRILDQRKVISTQHGRGTFVLDLDDRKKNQNRDPEEIEILTHFYLRKARYLGFGPEEIRAYFDRVLEGEAGNQAPK